MASIISGTGSALPNRVITNDHFVNNVFYKPDGEKIDARGVDVVKKLETISGIVERRYIDHDQDSADIVIEAANNAMENAGLKAEDIDAIIVAHNTGNMLPGLQSIWQPIPNIGCLVKNRLGMKNHGCVAYDILFGCPGWVEATIQAHRLLQLGEAQHVMVCGLEVCSRALDPHDMDSMLMADGCGVTILSADEHTDKGIQSHKTYSHAQDDLFNITMGPSNNKEFEGHCFFKMNGREVYRYATTWVPQVIKESLDQLQLTPRDIDMFFFHQANAKMLGVIAHNLMKIYGQENENYAYKIPSTISFLGNTSSATIPTMYDLVARGQLDGFALKEGQKYVFASVGVGMHCNSIVYQN